MPVDTVTSMFQFVCFSLLCGEITPAKDPYTPPKAGQMRLLQTRRLPNSDR